MGMLQLNEAANAGDGQRLQELLPQIPEEERTPWLREALLRAAYENRAAAVKALISVGAAPDDPAMVDGLGQTPLHWAARQGHEAIARILVEAGAAVEVRSQDGVTPLHIATELNIGAIVQLLLGRRADATTTTKDNRTALHVAAEHGSAVAAAALLGANPETDSTENVEAENDRNEGPLARASARGHAAVAQLLLQARADPDRRNFWGQAPLHLACFGGHVGAAAVLLDTQIDTNAIAQDGSTPLHVAVERGHSQVVELLLTRGADATVTATGGHGPLHRAAERGSTEAAEVLLAHGADPNAQTQEGRTPLSYAAARGHADVCKRLVEQKADPQALDRCRQTALHNAATNGSVEAANYLINRCRLRLDQEDAAGQVPMTLAIEAGQDNMVKALVKHGAALPDSCAEDPHLQELVRQAEKEMLEEQREAAANGELQAKYKAAEKDFEDARLRLLDLAEKMKVAESAPVTRIAEIALQDVRDLLRSTVYSTESLRREVKAVDDALKYLAFQDRDVSIQLQKLLDQIADMKELRRTAKAEEAKLTKETSEAQVAIKMKEMEQARLLADTQKAQQRSEDLRNEIRSLNQDSDRLREELQNKRDQVAQWNAKKDEARRLHAQAQDILSGSQQAH